MPIISSIHSRWILDSRGLPTVQTSLTVEQNGKKASATSSVPSGASTGSHEALELRDSDKSFHGKGVDKAVFNVVEKIGSQILNREFASAAELDRFVIDLDSSPNKSELGANAILSVSMAAYRAFASLYGLELWQYLRRIYFSELPASNQFPRLMCNVINGGEHADNALDIQEFMIVPNTGKIDKDIQLSSEIYHTLKKNLHKDKYSTSLGDEGGFAPDLQSSSQVLEYLQKAINDAGYTNASCDLAMDAAATEFFDKDKNIYLLEGKELNAQNLVDYYKDLTNSYNLISIEDAFSEDDIIGWQAITEKLGKRLHLIGDDLFVTNPKRFEEVGLTNSLANGVLIKLNQIGSVLETCEMINLAKKNGYITIVSHRSGETIDDFISDLAFASQSEFIKLGAPARGERVAKYNRLLQIKDDLE